MRVLSGFVLGTLALLLACELLLRVLPVSGATRVGTYVDPKIPTFQPLLETDYATGWDLRNAQRLRTNEMGFVAERSFKPDPNAVALIGDSFVDAASLVPKDRPAQQLEAALDGRRPVYSMGTAGSSLLDYAERIRFAHERLQIRDFVVLIERGDIWQAMCGSGNVASQCLDPASLAPRTELQPPASTVKRWLRQSALARYVASQLKLDPARLLGTLFKRTEPHAPAAPGAPADRAADGPRLSPAAFDAVLAAFVERIQPFRDGRLLLLVDADRRALAQGRVPADAQRQAFMQRARAAGLQVVDVEPLFAKHFASSHLSLEIGPYDGHPNALCYRLFADAAAKALAADRTGPEVQR
ncbi:MAG: hypothetical protein LCI02_07135 [Proteobacteria bacterium]|nr:hypothetical protein [Pseudomonadota bacterium]